MASSRRSSNGRSPLVNQQRQITSFFSKSSSSSSASTLLSKQTPKSQPNPNPNPKRRRSPSPNPSTSPTTPSPLQIKLKKPLLIIAPSSSSPSTPDKKSYAHEVVNKRVKVYWPLDQSWYEGCVKSFDKISGKHVIQYDDADEELLDLANEKVEWVEEVTCRKFRRLRRVSVVEDEEEEEEAGIDDSDDEDWGKNAEKEVAEEDVSDEGIMDLEDEVEEEEVGSSRRMQKSESKKRKMSGDGKLGNSTKKSKSARDDAKKITSKFFLNAKLVEPKDNGSKCVYSYVK